jgi:hypothetical protein
MCRKLGLLKAAYAAHERAMHDPLYASSTHTSVQCTVPLLLLLLLIVVASTCRPCRFAARL